MVERIEGQPKSSMEDNLGMGMSRPWPNPGTGVDQFNADYPDYSQPAGVPSDRETLAAGLQYASNRFARYLSAMTDIHKLAMVLRAEEKLKQAAKTNAQAYSIPQLTNHEPPFPSNAASGNPISRYVPTPSTSHGNSLPRNTSRNDSLNTSIYSQYITTSASTVPPGFILPRSYNVDTLAALRQIEEYTDAEMCKIISHLSCEASSNVTEISASIRTMYHMIWNIYKANRLHQTINHRTLYQQSAVCYPATNQNSWYTTTNQTDQIQQLQYLQDTQQVVQWNNPHARHLGWEPIPLPNEHTSLARIGSGEGPYVLLQQNYLPRTSVNNSYPMNGAGDASQCYYQHETSYRNGAGFLAQGQSEDYNYAQHQRAPQEYVPTQNMNLQEYDQRARREEAPLQRSYNEFSSQDNNENIYHVETVCHNNYPRDATQSQTFPEDGFMKKPYREILPVPETKHEEVRPPVDYEKCILPKTYRASTPPTRLYRKAEPELRACYEKAFLQKDDGEDNLSITYREELAPKKSCREQVLEEAFFKNVDPLSEANYEEFFPKTTCHKQAMEKAVYGKVDSLPKANREESACVKSCQEQALEQVLSKKHHSLSQADSVAFDAKKSFREQVLQHAFPDKYDSPRQTYKQYLEKEKFFRECIDASPKAYRKEVAPKKSRRELMEMQGTSGQYYNHKSYQGNQSTSDDSDDPQENNEISRPKNQVSAAVRGMQMQKIYHEQRPPFVGYSSRMRERSALNELVLHSASRNNLKKNKVAGSVLDKSLANFPLLGSSGRRYFEEEEASNPLDTSFFLSLFKKPESKEPPGSEEASRRLYNRGKKQKEEMLGTNYKPVPRPLLLASDIVQSELDSNVDLKDFFMVTSLLSKKSYSDFDKFYIHQKIGNKDTEINSGEESIRRKAYRKCDFFGWGCLFCKKNNCPYEIYSTHQLRNPVNGLVVCPYLRQHRCSLCQATGDHAHTRKHCPVYNRFY